MLRVGIDVGGTFTDLFAYNERTGETISAKVPTTVNNQADGVANSFTVAGLELGEIDFLAHGTTTGVNALIERKETNTALITTKGFRDVLEIMRTDRAVGYDLSWDKPKEFVPRRIRREVSERVLRSGAIDIPLDEDNARQVINELIEVGNIESIAVSLIHSYANNSHEQKLRQIISELSPETFVSLSSDINAEYREYERTNTVVVDAYIKPTMVRYIRSLVQKLDANGFGGKLFLMQGNGGMFTAERACEKPISTLASGPAAGSIAAAKIAAQANIEDIVTFDVGGTSTDVSLVHGGEPFLTTKREIEWGLPVRVPAIDVESVGAGGGSIAWLDQGGALKMGPRSAGSDPGPICYDVGGAEPTLSDALLCKGILGPDIAGGNLKLNIAKARNGLLKKLAEPLDLELERVVDGVIKISHENMANAVRAVSVWKGLDPRDLTLMAFGGAGGMVAGPVAHTLGMPRVIIPPNPGNASAMGLLMTDFKEDGSIAYIVDADNVDLDDLNNQMQTLSDETSDLLLTQGAASKRKELSFEYFADIRYKGQVYELKIPFGGLPISQDAFERAIECFKNTYEEIYSIRLARGIPEIVSLRVMTTASLSQYHLAAETEQSQRSLVPKGERNVLIDHELQSVNLYDRYSIPKGTPLQGPAILEESGSTIWVAPNMSCKVDEYQNVNINTEAQS